MNNKTVSGSLGAAQQAATIGVDDQDLLSIQITGTFVATASFEGTIDGTNWFALAAIPINSVTPGTPVISATAVGSWYVTSDAVGALVSIRTRCSAWTSGAIVVTMIAGRVGRA